MLYGYVVQSGYMGRIDEENDIWRLFPTEEEYIEYMES